MILQRNELISKLEDRLAGRVSAAVLAAWAFERFYAIEQGDTQVAPADTSLVAAVLDDLMFADDPNFALDEVDLHRLIAQLQQP